MNDDWRPITMHEDWSIVREHHRRDLWTAFWAGAFLNSIVIVTAATFLTWLEAV